MNDIARIILVEDHQLFRMGICAALQTFPQKYQVVGEASCAGDFYHLMSIPTEADIVLLDIRLPDESGVEVTKYIRVRYLPLKILVLSAENDSETILTLMESGIDGFISKNSSMSELMNAIDTVKDAMIISERTSQKS